jgi:hypothetical protein
VTIKTSPWVVAAVDNVVDLSQPAVQGTLGTTTAELTGEWAYTQAISGIAPTQILRAASRTKQCSIFDYGKREFRFGVGSESRSAVRDVGQDTAYGMFAFRGLGRLSRETAQRN